MSNEEIAKNDSKIIQTPPEIWHGRFLTLAKWYGSWSKDPEQKVGAVIVSPDRRNITPGYNGFPRGLKDTEERLNNVDIKLSLVIHAEVNAILNSKNCEGSYMYVTRPPCHQCALAIIQSGIAVVCHPPISEESKWYQSQILAHKLFEEAGVGVIHLMESRNREQNTH